MSWWESLSKQKGEPIKNMIAKSIKTPQFNDLNDVKLVDERKIRGH